MLTNNFLKITTGFLCGFGLFLYGIFLLSDALNQLASDKLKSIISKYTTSPFKGMLIGAIITAIIHSSSGTTAVTISLVRAGLMTLPQAMGIIIGANIGTTMTALLIGLDLAYLAPLLIFAGTPVIFLTKKTKIKTLGIICFSTGLLFYGMELMGSELQQLATVPKFTSFMIQFSNRPVLGLLSGTLLTALVQSSTVTTAILQKLYASGLVSLKGALPIMLGNNIGTTVTGLFVGIGGSVEARKTALFQMLYNVIGAIIFMVFLSPFYHLMSWIEQHFHTIPEMSIALSHYIFNLVSAIIFIWFVKEMEIILNKLIRK